MAGPLFGPSWKVLLLCRYRGAIWPTSVRLILSNPFLGSVIVPFRREAYDTTGLTWRGMTQRSRVPVRVHHLSLRSTPTVFDCNFGMARLCLLCIRTSELISDTSNNYPIHWWFEASPDHFFFSGKVIVNIFNDNFIRKAH